MTRSLPVALQIALPITGGDGLELFTHNWGLVDEADVDGAVYG